MAVLARADADNIANLLLECGGIPKYTILRGPAAGLPLTLMVFSPLWP